MAQIKELDTDKTKKLKSSEDWKPKFGQNQRNQVKKKLEQLDTSTNDVNN